MTYKQFAVVEFGGPIGSNGKNKVFVGANGWGRILESFDSEADAKASAKDYNKSRTDFEKNYYFYKYKSVKLTKDMLENLKQQSNV